MTAIDQIMEQAQVFASGWSLVDTQLDDGSAHDEAIEYKTVLRDLIDAAIADARREGAEQMLEACATAAKSALDAHYSTSGLQTHYSLAGLDMTIRALPLPAGPRQPDPSDPLDMPLPCDIKIGHVTHGKGTKLRTLVMRMRLLYDMAQAQKPAAWIRYCSHCGSEYQGEQECAMNRRPCRCGPDGCSDSGCAGRGGQWN